MSKLQNQSHFTLFFLNSTTTSYTYTLSLHDALPISMQVSHWAAFASTSSSSDRRASSRRSRTYRVRRKRPVPSRAKSGRSEEHTSELQSRQYLVCRLLLEKKKK